MRCSVVVRHSSFVICHLPIRSPPALLKKPISPHSAATRLRFSEPNACAKCHEKEVQQWKQTPHFVTFESLHRKPEAKAITKRLGLSTVKRNDTCVKCHYTQQQKGSRVRVVSGISCESCHGASENWNPLHNDYGGANVTKEMESPEHRQQRIEASIAAGMNNPSNPYLIARQCLACHTTPDEKLVNVGGHTAGSPDFELVAWSQGMIRHNFLRTGGTSNGTASKPNYESCTSSA